MSRVPAFMLAAAIASLPAASMAETIRQQSEMVFEGAGLQGVQVENARGVVRVTTSQDGKVHLTAVKESRGATRRRAERLAIETRVTAEVLHGVLQVRVHYPGGERHEINIWQVLTGGYEHPRFQVRLGLEVPATLALDVRVASGDVLTDGITGPQTITSASGDVVVQNALGLVKASSTSGDLEATTIVQARLSTRSGDVLVTDARGPLRVHSTSGDLTVRGAADSLVIESVSGDVGVTDATRGVSAKSTSGDVLVRGVAGVVRAETSSGDIGLRVVDPLRRVDASATSGDVTVRVLSTSGCTLDLSTASGTIDVPLPVELRSATRRTLRGTVGAGTVPITLKTASGDIAVRGPRK